METGIVLALLGIALVSDLARREVPDAVPLGILAAACFRAATAPGCSWASLALGLLCGLAIGTFLFHAASFGGGDAKLLIALGAWLGPVAIWPMLFWTAVAGGGLAIWAACRGRHDYAYVPAIVAGTLLPWCLGRGA